MMRTKCLLILLLQWTLAYSQSIDIEQAVKNKLIVVDASINSTPINGHYVAGFSGECIQLKVKNISNAYREIVLSSGQFLVPEDSNQQRMLNTLAVTYKLNPGQEVSKRITAFCSQADKVSPSQTQKLTLHNKANGNLLKLAVFIDEKKIKSVAAQEAIWALAANQRYHIDRDNPESGLLYGFMKTNLNFKPDTTSYHSYRHSAAMEWIRTVRIKVEYEMGRKSKMRVVVLNEKLEILKMIVDNQVQERGVYTYNTTLRIPIDREITEDQYCIVRYFKDDVQLCERRYKLSRYNE